MIKVGLLFDAENGWIEKYLSGIGDIEELRERYIFKSFYDPEKIVGYEIVFILGYTRILQKSFLDSNGLNLVIHESGLPEGRGFSPVQWQVLEGKNVIPVCLFEATEALDAGDIFDVAHIEFTGYELFNEIRQEQANVSLKLMQHFLIDYPHNTRTKQSGKSSLYRRRNVQDDMLDADKTLREQFNHFRIADNERHPLYFTIAGHKYYLTISKKMQE